MRLLIAWVVTLGLGCVEPFHGSHINFDLEGIATPCEAITTYQLPAPKACTGKREEDRFLYYYELWAVLDRSVLQRVLYFTVQPHLFKDEQLKLEQDEIKLADGTRFQMDPRQRFSEMNAADREKVLDLLLKAESALAITSYSKNKFKAAGQLADHFYLGNHLHLTSAHNGTYLGQVRGFHPQGQLILSGATATSPLSLRGLSALMLTVEGADPDRPDPRPSNLVVLDGEAERRSDALFHVVARSKHDSAAQGLFSIAISLDTEELF